MLFHESWEPHLGKMYRYESVLTSSYYEDDYGEHWGTPGVAVYLHSYPIIKWTPKGVRIALYGDETKFILLDARKRWASPTEEEAAISFLARKTKQIQILTSQIASAGQACEVLLKKEEEGRISRST